MNKIILMILFCLFSSKAFSAELLVRVAPHWQDSLTPVEVSQLTTNELDAYNSRTQIGDIIVVRPDGWQWGREERLPIFIVVKIPNLTIEQAKIYEENLIDNTNPQRPKILKRRKYKIPKVIVDNAKQLSQSEIIIPETEKDAFMMSIIKKTQ